MESFLSVIANDVAQAGRALDDKTQFINQVIS